MQTPPGNASRVVPELMQPTAAATFVTTVAMIVFSTTGVVGLVGLLRGGAANLAARTWKSALAIVGLAAIAGVAAGELGREAAGLEHDVVAADFASELTDEGTYSHTFDAPGTYE